MFFLSLLKLLFTLGTILSLKCFFTLFLILPFVFLIVLFLKFLLILLSTFMLEFRPFSVSKLIIFPPKFNWRRILSVIKSFSFIFSMHFSTRFFLRWSEFFTFFRIVFTINHAFFRPCAPSRTSKFSFSLSAILFYVTNVFFVNYSVFLCP